MTKQQLYLLLSHYLQKEPNDVLVNILYKELKKQNKALNMLHIVIVARYKRLEITFKLLKLKLRRYLEGDHPIPELVELLFLELHEANNPANWLDTQVFTRYEELAYYFEG